MNAPTSSTACAIDLSPRPLELILLALLVIFYLIAEDVHNLENLDFANIVGPVWLVAALIVGLVHSLRANRAAIWTSMFWLRLATAVYFGFGAVVPFFVNETTREYIDAFYSATPDQIFKVNLVTALGILVILGTAAATLNLLPRARWLLP